MWKNRLIDILSPLLYFLLERVLRNLKPLFCAEDEVLRKGLRRMDFHPALCAHPSILFGHRESLNVPRTSLLSFQLRYLKKAVKIGLFKTDKGHAIMQLLGMPPYYGNGLEFWFEEWHTPLIPYDVPTETTQPKHVVIYSALTGDYDYVNEILYKEEGVDYLLLTNNKSLTSKTWQNVYVESDLDNVLLSREIKMLPQKYLGDKYDVSIYVDASAVIYGEFSRLAAYLHDDIAFAVSQHSERKTIREEIDAIVSMKSMNLEQTLAQYNRYREDGFEDNIGLAECGVLVRKHQNIALQKVMNSWWTEFQNGIRRDQISLLPIMAKLQYTDWQYMKGNIWHNQYFKIISHKQ